METRSRVARMIGHRHRGQNDFHGGGIRQRISTFLTGMHGVATQRMYQSAHHFITSGQHTDTAPGCFTV